MVMHDMQTYLSLAYQNISATDMPELCERHWYRTFRLT